MNNRSMKKRLLVLAMVVLAAGSGLIGCSKKDSGTEAVMDKDHVYKAEYIDLPEGIANVGRLKAGKDRVYLQGYNVKKGYNYMISSVKLDGTDMKVIYEQDSKEQSNVSAYTVDADGNVCFLKSKFEEDTSDPENIQSKNTNWLIKLDADGKEIFSVELKGKEEINANDMMFDKDGSIIIVCYDSMKIYDKEGKFKASVDLSGSNIDNTFMTEGGKILVSGYSKDYIKREIKEFLPNEKKFSEPMDIETSVFTNSAFFPGIGYDLLLKDSTDLYGYNMETKEKTKLANWIDSDINGSMINNLLQLPDGRIVFVSQNYMKNPAVPELAILTKVAPEDVVEKTVLTLAASYVDMQVSGVVIDFNKKNEKYRITIKDYSVYSTEDDYMGGTNKLNNDIISGDVPDLMCLNDPNAFQSFISKGLLLDMNQMMEKDKDFNRSDYLENIFAAYEKDGKMYSLVPYFNIFTFVGKTSNVGKEMGWTLDDLKKLVDSKPEGTEIFDNMTQSLALTYGSFLGMDSYVDYKNGTSNFDTQEYKDLLEFAKQFPKEQKDTDGGISNSTTVSPSNQYENEETLYKKDKVLLMESYIYNYNEIHRLQKVTFGEDITFIGFPTANKKGSAIISGLELAISSQSGEKDAAWEFAKSFLSDSFQDELAWGWPTKLSSLEKKKEKEQKPKTYTDENGKEAVYEDTYTENGKEVKLGTVTDEECEKFMTFLKSLTQVLQNDMKVSEIIEEESAAYFADQKSVDETTKLIQNRVQTYLSEKR